MSKVQHQLAHELLALVRASIATHRLLTYQTAAKALGRPINHARAIAQVCDLMDAAAAFAKVPMLALVAIRAANGDINPKAWVRDTPPGVREAVINRSLAHTFTPEDFSAIERSLLTLKDYGNRAAWAYVMSIMPKKDFYRQLTTQKINLVDDAINDLDPGSDRPEKKKTTTTITYERDPQVRKKVTDRASGYCEMCGKKGFARPDGSLYLETHHIIALANDGADRITNVIALCADHHREAHFGALREELEDKMIARVKELESK